jgi:ATP-dependent RNA helicase DHX57
VVAQPRRLAATGVATRVANERGEDKAGVDSVGYVVRGDSALNDRSRLVFCTTGVLLRQMQSKGALDSITHIVVDEVHERQLDTDILLGLLKKTLSTYPNLRVILMSATLDADRFAGYWGSNTPRMHIPGRTFPVTDYTLEDVLSLTGYIPRKNKKGKGSFYRSSNSRQSTPWNDSEKSDGEDEGDVDDDDDQPQSGDRSGNDHGIPIEQLVERIDETSVEYDLLAQLVKRLVMNKDPGDDGSILVFLPGAPEIGNAMETIKRCTKSLPILALPLHGGLQPREQNLVFSPAQKGFTKVILSTNVAETSITIPDCTIVIDCAREKQSSYDPANRMPLLVERFASLASLKQRRGRAGRVQQGTCYKLISKSTLSKLSEHGEPEILRCALDQTLLSLLYLGVENGAGSFMSTLLDPPSSVSLQAAATSLLQIGAVEAGSKEKELMLTPLGVHLAGIPAVS